MNAADIVARVRRLDQLSRGLAKEIQLVEKADDPMLYVERMEYLAAIRQARASKTRSWSWRRQSSESFVKNSLQTRSVVPRYL